MLKTTMGIIAALSTVSGNAMQLNTTQKVVSRKDWEDFITDVNKEINDKPNLVTNLKFKNSDLYKSQTWTDLSLDDVVHRTRVIFMSNEFTMEEKKYIARRIIDNYSYENIWKSIGLDGDTSYTDKNTSVIDTSLLKHGVDDEFMIDGKKVSNTLKWGNEGDWTSYKEFDKLFAFNQQQILDMTLSYVKYSDEFRDINELLTEMRYARDIKLKEFMIEFVNKTKALMVKLLGDGYVTSKLMKSETFEIFDFVDFSTCKDDVETYEKLVYSSLGKVLFNQKDVEYDVNEYKNNPDEREFLNGDVIHNIIRKMSRYSKFSSRYTKFIDSKNPLVGSDPDVTLTEEDYPQMLKVFRNVTLNNLQMSKDLSTPVTWRVQGSLVDGIALQMTNERLVDNNWKELNESNYPILGVEVSDSFFFTRETHREFEDYDPRDIQRKIYSNNYYAHLDNSSTTEDDLKLSTGEVMSSGSNASYNMYLIGKNKYGLQVLKPYKRVHENDHDSDGSVKGRDWNVKPSYHYEIENFSKDTISSGFKDFAIHFRWDDSNSGWAAEKSFPELDAKLNNSSIFSSIFYNINHEIEKIKTGLINVPSYKKNMKLSYKVYFEGINFSEIRFNTYDDSGYDDTHSDRFRFNGVTANFSYEIYGE